MTTFTRIGKHTKATQIFVIYVMYLIYCQSDQDILD